MDVKQLWVTLVHLYQDRGRKLPGVGDDVHANFFERRQVLRLLGSNVGLVETPILVPAEVLGVENVLIVVLPKEIANAAMLIGGYGAVVRFAESANPYVQDAIDGCEIAELRAIGRDLRVGALGVPEQHFARNQWRCKFLLGSYRRNEEHRQYQNGNSAFEQTHKASIFRTIIF